MAKEMTMSLKWVGSGHCGLGLTHKFPEAGGGVHVFRPGPASSLRPVIWNEPTPLPRFIPPVSKMKGSEVPGFENVWNVLNPFKIPIKTVTNPWKMHQGCVATLPVSMMSPSQMKVCKVQRLLGANLFINTVSLLCHFPLPTSLLTKEIKTAFKNPCLETSLITAPRVFTHSTGVPLSTSFTPHCLHLSPCMLLNRKHLGEGTCGYGRFSRQVESRLCFRPGSSVWISLYLLSSSSKAAWELWGAQEEGGGSRLGCPCLSEGSGWWGGCPAHPMHHDTAGEVQLWTHARDTQHRAGSDQIRLKGPAWKVSWTRDVWMWSWRLDR